MGEEHFRENKISQVILIFETKIVDSYNFLIFLSSKRYSSSGNYCFQRSELAIFVVAIMSRGVTEVKMLTDQSQDYHV